MTVIDEYFKGVEVDKRRELERIRRIANAVIPGAEEAISYGMPTIKYHGKSIIGFDAHKNHIGIYPFSGSVIARIPELSKYDQTPGAIKEKLDDLVPNELIEKLIRIRMEVA